MKITLITECKGRKMGGLARYEKSLADSMRGKINFTLKHASEIKKQSRFRQILNLFLTHEKIKKNGEITHLLNQQLALSLNFVRLHNVIVTIHDLAFMLPKYHKSLSIAEKMRYALVKKGLSRVERVIVDVPFTKNEVMKYLDFPEGKIDVIPLGVDHSVFRIKDLGKKRAEYRHYQDSMIVLYVGSEIPRMNFLSLLKAFYELKKELPAIRLLKVGESKCPAERRRIVNMIKRWGIEKDVKFIEYVSEEDLVNYYNSADLFVYPIEYTGFGLPPLEAMACGCPVVCSNGSCLPDVVGDAALLFDPGNVAQLKECVHSLLIDNNLRKKMIKRGLSMSKLFRWDICANETIKVYRKLNRFLSK